MKEKNSEAQAVTAQSRPKEQAKKGDQESRLRERARRDLSGSLRHRQQQYRADQEQFPKT